MDIKLMAQEELDALLVKMKGMTVEQQVKMYLRLRTGKSAIKKHLDVVESQYKTAMETLENLMLQAADKLEVGGFTIPGVGTTYTAEEKKISIADDNAFFGYVLSQSDLDFFERRVSVTHVNEHMKLNGGVAPPGLNIFRERVMRVRKATEKATS
jgi:hypothetical protein